MPFTLTYLLKYWSYDWFSYFWGIYGIFYIIFCWWNSVSFYRPSNEKKKVWSKVCKCMASNLGIHLTAICYLNDNTCFRDLDLILIWTQMYLQMVQLTIFLQNFNYKRSINGHCMHDKKISYLEAFVWFIWILNNLSSLRAYFCHFWIWWNAVSFYRPSNENNQDLIKSMQFSMHLI